VYDLKEVIDLSDASDTPFIKRG